MREEGGWRCQTQSGGVQFGEIVRGDVICDVEQCLAIDRRTLKATLFQQCDANVCVDQG